MDHERQKAARNHLQELVESPVFSRAPNQIKALAAMVNAACEGREQSGADLAQAVYGRADESYIRAVRQLARELRMKLPLVYESWTSYPIRFELHPHHYAVRVIAHGSGAILLVPAPQDALSGLGPRRSRRGARTGIAVLAATLSLGAIAATVWIARRAPRLGVPARIEGVNDQLAVLDASGKPLPGWRQRLEEASGFPFQTEPVPPGSHKSVQAVVLEAPPGHEARLALVACDKRVGNTCAVHLLAAGSGEELDRFELPRLPAGVSTGARLHEVDGETFVPDWLVSSIDRADLDGDGVHDEIVLVVYLGRIFPSQVLALDYDGSWRTLADFWTMGGARAVSLPDLDGDGRDEIVAYGTNNSYQRAFLTVLASAAGFPVGARSPDGYRLARLAEVAHYPFAGLTLQFPFTDLARDASERHLRNVVTAVTWDSGDAAMDVTVSDAATNSDTGDCWQVGFRLEAGATPSTAFVVQYDAALARLLRLIADGRLEDRWNVVSTQRLSEYGRDLASRILVWDARDPQPAWRPIRNGELLSVFPYARMTVTTSAR